MDIKEFCINLLNKCGRLIDCYSDNVSYGGYEYALKDIYANINDGEIYPFSAESIANELVIIGNENYVKTKRKKYCAIFDTEDMTDSLGYFDDLEKAYNMIVTCYESWIEMYNCDNAWMVDDNGVPHPTEEQIEDWNSMIWNCTCWVAQWDEDEQDYYDEKMNYLFMSDEDAYSIDWLEWDELKEKYGW